MPLANTSFLTFNMSPPSLLPSQTTNISHTLSSCYRTLYLYYVLYINIYSYAVLKTVYRYTPNKLGITPVKNET